jgi:hypothetical protein
MVTSLAGTTQLESINTMLSMIGQAPINSLSGTLPLDATIATNTLTEILREVQAAGWHFNTEFKVTLALDDDSKIPLGTNVMRVDLDPTRYSKRSYDVVKRGGFLYEKNDHTYVFTKAVDATIIYYLEFEELPENVKRYITIRAGRIFADRVVGERELHGFTTQEELNALAILKQEEADTANHNIFDSFDTGKIVARETI